MENIHSMKKQFSFDLKIPGQQTRRFRMKESFTIGSGDDANLRLRNSNLPNVALKFGCQDGVPTITCVEKLDHCRLKGQDLGVGKLYILEVGDVIGLGQIEMTILKATEEKNQHEESQIEESLQIKKEDNDNKSQVNKGQSEENLQIKKEDNDNKGQVNKGQEEESLQIKKEDNDNKGQVNKGQAEESLQIKQDDMAESEEISLNVSKVSKKRKSFQHSLKKVFPTKKTKKTKKQAVIRPFPSFFVRLPAVVLFLIMVLAIDLYVLQGNQWQQMLIAFCEHWGSILVNAAFEQFFILLKDQVPPDQVALIARAYEPIKSQILAGDYYFFDFLRLAVLTVSIDLVSHLLFGTSIPLFICGVTDEGSFLAKRLRGGVRSVIGWCTIWALIYDAPLLFGKRSFKEIITMTRLGYRQTPMRFIGPWIVFPLCLCLLLGTSFINHYKELSEEISFAKHDFKEVVWEADVRKKSHAFLLKGSLDIPEGWILMPFYRKGKKEKSVWGINLFNRNNQGRIRFDFQNTLNFANIMSNLKEEDPLLKYFSPTIYKYLRKEKKAKVPKADTEEFLDEQAEEEEEIRHEMETIFFTSLALSISTMPDFIKSRGIFFKPYLEIRKTFYNNVLRDPAKWDHRLSRFGSKSFLEVKGERKDGGKVIYFLPIAGLENPLFRLKYAKKDRILVRKLIKSFIKNYSPFSSESKPFRTEDVAEWNAYNIPDFLRTLDKRGPRKKEVRQVTNFFMSLGKMTLGDENKVFRDIFLAELKKIDRFLKSMTFGEGLNIELNQIQKAVEKENREFFR